MNDLRSGMPRNEARPESRTARHGEAKQKKKFLEADRWSDSSRLPSCPPICFFFLSCFFAKTKRNAKKENNTLRSRATTPANLSGRGPKGRGLGLLSGLGLRSSYFGPAYKLESNQGA